MELTGLKFKSRTCTQSRMHVSAQIERFLCCINYLTVQANSKKHEKEKNGPQVADRHLSNGFWVTHKGKSGT